MFEVFISILGVNHLFSRATFRLFSVHYPEGFNIELQDIASFCAPLSRSHIFHCIVLLSFFPEYVNGGELFTHLCSRGFFDVHTAKFIIAELIVAIDSVHKVS